MSAQLDILWDLARAWGPACEPVVIEDAVHGEGGGMSDVVRAAVARFAASWG